MALIAAWTVFASPGAQAQSFFNFAPATAPLDAKPAVQATPPVVEDVIAPRRTVALRKKTTRRARAVELGRESARDAARDADKDVPKDGQQGGLGTRINSNTIAMVCGGLDATTTAIAADLSSLLDDGDNLRILPVLGKEARNIRDVRFMKGVDLGITHANLLGAYKRGNLIGPIDDRIVYVTKLFEEEMHVVVRADSGITAIGQLSGQKVNFAEVGSGTQLTTRDLFARLGIKAVEVNLSQAEALQQLRKGDIAATVAIAGKPAAAMSQLSSEGFRLLPVPYPKQLQNDYLPSSLSARDYPALVGAQRPVDTVAVSAVLIAYNWPKGSDHYRRIETFVEAFFPRLADFQAPARHPKWRDVNLAAALPGWKRFEAADDWLQRARPQVRNQQGSSDTFTAALDGLTGSGNARAAPEFDHLFQEFLKWNQARGRH